MSEPAPLADPTPLVALVRRLRAGDRAWTAGAAARFDAWLDGLERPEPLRGLVERHAHMHVLHGHTHAAADRAVGRGRDAQVFCVPAAVDTDEPVRVYEATEQRLRPLCGPAARPVQSRERRRPTLPSLAASA